MLKILNQLQVYMLWIGKKTYVGLLPDNFLNGLTVNEGIKKWQEYLNKEKHRIFVAYENEKILGFSACKEVKNKRIAYI